MQKKLEEQRQQMSEMWEQNAQLSRVKNEFIPGLVRSGLLIYDRDKNDLTMVDSWDKHQQQLQQDLERDAQEALSGYGKQNQNQQQQEQSSLIQNQIPNAAHGNPPGQGSQLGSQDQQQFYDIPDHQSNLSQQQILSRQSMQ